MSWRKNWFSYCVLTPFSGPALIYRRDSHKCPIKDTATNFRFLGTLIIALKLSEWFRFPQHWALSNEKSEDLQIEGPQTCKGVFRDKLLTIIFCYSFRINLLKKGYWYFTCKGGRNCFDFTETDFICQKTPSLHQIFAVPDYFFGRLVKDGPLFRSWFDIICYRLLTVLAVCIICT
jgi:hypothetical protein